MFARICAITTSDVSGHIAWPGGPNFRGDHHAQVHHLDHDLRRSDHVRRHEFGSHRLERDAFCFVRDERSSSVSGQRYGSNGSPRPCAFVRIVIARSRPKALRIAGAQAPAAALMWRPERRKPLVFTVIHNTGARAGLRDNSIRCERSHRLARRADQGRPPCASFRIPSHAVQSRRTDS